jgi:hypothetical protein
MWPDPIYAHHENRTLLAWIAAKDVVIPDSAHRSPYSVAQVLRESTRVDTASVEALQSMPGARGQQLVGSVAESVGTAPYALISGAGGPLLMWLAWTNNSVADGADGGAHDNHNAMQIRGIVLDSAR